MTPRIERLDVDVDELVPHAETVLRLLLAAFDGDQMAKAGAQLLHQGASQSHALDAIMAGLHIRDALRALVGRDRDELSCLLREGSEVLRCAVDEAQADIDLDAMLSAACPEPLDDATVDRLASAIAAKVSEKGGAS